MRTSDGLMVYVSHPHSVTKCLANLPKYVVIELKFITLMWLETINLFNGHQFVVQ